LSLCVSAKRASLAVEFVFGKLRAAAQCLSQTLSE
jgi:hypothetical protein